MKDTDGDGMTLDTLLTEIYVPLKLRGRSAESVRLLRHAINQFSLWLGRPATTADLDDLVVSKFLQARREKIAPVSVARERSGILALWNLAQARALVKYRPCVQAELVPERTPRALTVDELRRLADSAATASGWVGPVPAGKFFLGLMLTMFETGERISAVLWTPRDGWRRPFLTIPPHVRKGGRQERIYEVSQQVADLIDATSAHDGPTVFWWPYSTNALRSRWKAITRAAGLGDGRDVQFHALRRSTASHLIAAGGDATQQLGHSCERITRKSYIDPRITMAGKPKVYELLPKIAPPSIAADDGSPATIPIGDANRAACG